MLLLLVVAALFCVINSIQGAPTNTASKYNTIPLPKFEGDMWISMNGTLKPNYKRFAILCPDEEPLYIDKIEEAIDKKNGEIRFSLGIQIMRQERVLKISSLLNSEILAKPDIDPESMTNFGLLADIDKLHTLKFSFK